MSHNPAPTSAMFYSLTFDSKPGSAPRGVPCHRPAFAVGLAALPSASFQGRWCGVHGDVAGGRGTERPSGVSPRPCSRRGSLRPGAAVERAGSPWRRAASAFRCRLIISTNCNGRRRSRSADGPIPQHSEPSGALGLRPAPPPSAPTAAARWHRRGRRRPPDPGARRHMAGPAAEQALHRRAGKWLSGGCSLLTRRSPQGVSKRWRKSGDYIWRRGPLLRGWMHGVGV